MELLVILGLLVGLCVFMPKVVLLFGKLLLAILTISVLSAFGWLGSGQDQERTGW